MNKLLILSSEATQYAELLEAADLPQLEISAALDCASAQASIASCNIILGDPPLAGEVLASAARLEWLQSSWAGVDHLCRSNSRRDYLLTNSKGMFGKLVSEYVMTYLFALERQVFKMLSNQGEKRWQPLAYRPARDIALGIIGLGSIGRRLAVTARHFGIRVTGLNRSGKPCDEVEKVYTSDDLAGFLEGLDYIVLTLPATPQTKHVINADVLRLMKPSAVLMNVGRGNSVNEADLVQALRDGVISGAVLDVFENEPLDAESPFWLLPNVFITPHTSAISFPEEIAGLFIDNYKRFLQHEPLLHVVDFDLGY